MYIFKSIQILAKKHIKISIQNFSLPKSGQAQGPSLNTPPEHDVMSDEALETNADPHRERD